MTKPCHCSYGKTLFAILGKGKGFQIKIMFHLFFRNKFNGGGEGNREAKINFTLHKVKLLRVSQNERLGSEALESLRNTPLKTTPTEQSSLSMTERHISKPGHYVQLTFSFFLPFFFSPILPSLQEQSGHEPPEHWYHNHPSWRWDRKRNSIIISTHVFSDHPCLPKQ